MPKFTKRKQEICQNCGSKDHKTRDCLQRPKKYGYRTEQIKQFQLEQKLKEETSLQKQVEKKKENELKEREDELERLTREIQEYQNQKGIEEYVNEKEEEEKINEQLEKKRMATQNLRKRDDVAPYLRDLDGSNYRVEKEIDDVKMLWEDEQDPNKRNYLAFF